MHVGTLSLSPELRISTGVGACSTGARARVLVVLGLGFQSPGVHVGVRTRAADARGRTSSGAHALMGRGALGSPCTVPCLLRLSMVTVVQCRMVCRNMHVLVHMTCLSQTAPFTGLLLFVANGSPQWGLTAEHAPALV